MLALRLAITGDLRRQLDAEADAGRRAVTSVVRRKTNQLKNSIRRQIRRAGLGARLEKTVRGDAYPVRNHSFNARGLVYSKAYVKTGRSGRIDIITTFDEGATVRPRRGRFLALPTENAPRGARGRALSPSESRLNFILVPASDRRHAGLLLHPAPPHPVAYVLVREVRIRPRLNIDRAVTRALANVDELIARQWDRNARNAGLDL